jgi:hypothetical protein
MKYAFIASLVAALAVAVSAASSADAAPGWFIEGKALTGTANAESHSGSYTLKAPAAKTGVKCEVNINIFLLAVAGKATDKNTFEKCVGLEEAVKCEVHSPGQPNGTIKTNENVALLEEGGATFAKFTPQEGTTLVTIILGGASCPTKGEFAVSGFAQSKVAPQKEEVVKLGFEFSATSGSKLTFAGLVSATLEGKDETFLTGINEGKKWGIV